MKVLFLFLFCTTGMFAQQPEEIIIWSETSLSWDDFKASSAPQNGFHASANTGISYSWSAKMVGNEMDFDYTVKAFFYPDNSWVSEKNDRLLKHEQLHFDISEFHARLLRKKLKEFKPQEQKDLKEALRSIYETIETGRKQMQEQYDAETQHGKDVAVQEQWEQRIGVALERLKEYKAKE